MYLISLPGRFGEDNWDKYAVLRQQCHTVWRLRNLFAGDFLQHPKTIKLVVFCICVDAIFAACAHHIASHYISLHLDMQVYVAYQRIFMYIHVLSIEYIQSVAVYISIWLLLFKFFQPVSTVKMCPKWGFTAAARRWDLTEETKIFKKFKMEWLQVGMIQSNLTRLCKMS